jgi:hypothetical protein
MKILETMFIMMNDPSFSSSRGERDLTLSFATGAKEGSGCRHDGALDRTGRKG